MQITAPSVQNPVEGLVTNSNHLRCPAIGPGCEVRCPWKTCQAGPGALRLTPRRSQPFDPRHPWSAYSCCFDLRLPSVFGMGHCHTGGAMYFCACERFGDPLRGPASLLQAAPSYVRLSTRDPLPGMITSSGAACAFAAATVQDRRSCNAIGVRHGSGWPRIYRARSSFVLVARLLGREHSL